MSAARARRRLMRFERAWRRERILNPAPAQGLAHRRAERRVRRPFRLPDPYEPPP